MTSEKSRAIVIRTVPFGETSSVVSLYCREFGKVRALAKGAWRPKSSFDGALDLLSTCEVLVRRKSSGGLDLLTEACLERRFRVGGSYRAFLGGMHVAELLDALTADADSQPELFDSADGTLRELSETHEPDDRISVLLVSTELAFLRLTGHAPALFHCAECRRPLGGTGRTPFGMLDGGCLCGRCRAGKRAVISVSADGLAALRRLAGPAAAGRTPLVPGAVTGELRAIMTTYLAHLLGRPPRVARLLQPRTAPRRTRAE